MISILFIMGVNLLENSLQPPCFVAYQGVKIAHTETLAIRFILFDEKK